MLCKALTPPLGVVHRSQMETGQLAKVPDFDIRISDFLLVLISSFLCSADWRLALPGPLRDAMAWKSLRWRHRSGVPLALAFGTTEGTANGLAAGPASGTRRLSR